MEDSKGLVENSASILIPTCNMAAHLIPLWTSIVETGLIDQVDEVLFVNDGSTDGTKEQLVDLSNQQPHGRKIRTLDLDSNQGRFLARFQGAKTLNSHWILFLDSRLTLEKNFAKAFTEALKRGKSTVGWVDIDVTKNIFCLYWQRSHQRLFRNHFRHDDKFSNRVGTPIELSLNNYDQFLKGTTVFLCPRESFVEACVQMGRLDIKNDDTFLLKQILRTQSMVIDPRLRIHWEPRSDMLSFLLRLFERGPSFVEYHVFQRQGLFFYVVLIGVLAIATWLWVLVTETLIALELALLGLGLIALSSVLFTRSFWEWLRIGPLHVLVVLFFGTGVLWGLIVNLFRTVSLSEPKR